MNTTTSSDDRSPAEQHRQFQNRLHEGQTHEDEQAAACSRERENHPFRSL